MIASGLRSLDRILIAVIAVAVPLLAAVSTVPAALTVTIAGDASMAVSMPSEGATDAADMCMNSKYPPTVMMETPANAITPEASLWILVKTACCLNA